MKQAMIDVEPRGKEHYQVTLTIGVQKFNVGPQWNEREEGEQFAQMLQSALYTAGVVEILVS